MNGVKTLLERAKPELVEAIENFENKNPLGCEYMKKELSEVYWIHTLTWGTWVTIQSIWQSKHGNMPADPWVVFGD
jgi:hypothetical protein